MKAFKFNPLKELDISIPRNKRKEALAQAAETLKAAMLDYIGGGNSPVSGFGKFPKYTAEYKRLKSEISSTGTVNLELTGELLDALEVDVIGSSLKVFVDGDAELQGKAEGNNLGTYGKANPIPGKTRRFIPLDGEKFKRDIMQQVKDALKDFENGED